MKIIDQPRPTIAACFAQRRKAAARAAARQRALLSTALVITGLVITGITLEREKHLQQWEVRR